MALTVYVTRLIPDAGMNILKSKPDKLKVRSWQTENAVPREELLKQVAGVHGILCTVSDIIDEEVLNAAGPSLKVITSFSVGLNHINISECKKRNIDVVGTPDVASDAAAEFSVGLVLLVARRLLEGMHAVVNGEWGLWKPMWICGFEMGGRTLGILGFGRVGFGIARRLLPFNIKRIIYHDQYQKEYARGMDAELVDRDTLLKESDILCICCAVTPVTTKSLNKTAFAKMKEGSILINTARGQIVDHDDLDEALKNGRPMAAGLDVTDPEPLPPDHPLHKNSQCIITPHLATATMTTRAKMAQEAALNLFVSLLGASPLEATGQ